MVILLDPGHILGVHQAILVGRPLKYDGLLPPEGLDDLGYRGLVQLPKFGVDLLEEEDQVTLSRI